MCSVARKRKILPASWVCTEQYNRQFRLTVCSFGDFFVDFCAFISLHELTSLLTRTSFGWWFCCGQANRFLGNTKSSAPNHAFFQPQSTSLPVPHFGEPGAPRVSHTHFPLLPTTVFGWMFCGEFNFWEISHLVWDCAAVFAVYRRTTLLGVYLWRGHMISSKVRRARRCERCHFCVTCMEKSFRLLFV